MNELILQYVDYERNVLNHSSIWENRYYTLRKLDLFLREKKWKDFLVSDIELQDILSFITYLKTTPITNWWHKNGKYPWASAIFNCLCAVRMFCKFLNIIGYKLKFNWEQIPMYKCPDKKREPMRKEDYEKLREAPYVYADSYLEAVRDELLIDIPRETWLRRAEIVRIKFEDFHNDSRQFQVLVKWWRYENVFISQHLKNRILKFEQELKNKYPYTVWTYVISHIKIRDRGRVFTPERASSTIHKYVSILQEKWELNKNITLHQARHSFAMRCVYSGISHQATMQLMRHKDPKSTLHYYHLNDTWLQEQFDKVQ